ncbi:MAG: bifunctional phosphoglucose/phosphomannose isomerase [Thermoleophilia bacterium]|nr:bifunctional phosphoglucose/phosphomannose isomerase [Thermoleophilia bacterium]TFG71607.1 MAG: bifunctional phosphoglucose/phosphomannose isomerase [Solirubrobacterales bacterium]
MSDLKDRLAEIDSGDQYAATMALPDHLRDALWRFSSAKIEPIEASGLVVCGMGGSAIGGDLAAAALGGRLGKPHAVVRGYGVPSWSAPDGAIFCSSYSGQTEETMACYAAAEAVGAKRIVATTGGVLAEAARADGVPVIGMPAGLQPRAAVGYTFAIAAEVAAVVGAGPAIRMEIDSSAAHLEAASESLLAKASELADAIAGSVPLVYGCGLTAPVSYRWKTQINENAKLPCFHHILPEMDHNEIVGWAGGGDGTYSAIFLEDEDQHPRERQRVELTAGLIEPQAQSVVRLETEGQTRTERLLWAVMLGDLLSLELAARAGVDPTPVTVIESLKDRLGRP